MNVTEIALASEAGGTPDLSAQYPEEIARIHIGTQARENLFDVLKPHVVEHIHDVSIQSTIVTLKKMISLPQLETGVRMLGHNASYGKSEAETILSTAMDISKKKLDLLNRFSSSEDEREVALIAKLLRIVEVIEKTIIATAKSFMSKPAQRESLDAKEQVMKLGEKAYNDLRAILNTSLVSMPIPLKVLAKTNESSKKNQEKDAQQQSFVKSVLAAEEVLGKKHDELMSDKHEHIDRLALFRKLAANMRKNANIFHASKLNFRINQLKGLNALIEFLQNEGYGDRIGYFKQPTGAGKTVLFGIIARLMSVKTLVLVPRTNLVTQTRDELIDFVGFQANQIGICASRINGIGHQVTIATYQTHLSRMKYDDAYRKEVEKCELVICDEAHKSLGTETQNSISALDGELDEEMTEEDEVNQEEVLENIDQYTSNAALKLGFTATPELRQKSVERAYKVLIAETSYSELVLANVIKKFKVKQVEATLQPNDVKRTIAPAQERNMLERENVYEGLLRAYKEATEEIEEDLYGLATCANIEECDTFAEIAKKLGLRCVIVTSREYTAEPEIDHKKRAETLLLEKKKELIVTVDKLKEGWNFRPLNAVILARATLSPANILQPAGRASRTYQQQRFAYIFEAYWYPLTLTDSGGFGDGNGGGGGNGTFSRSSSLEYKKPLSFADALYLSGEKHLNSVCEGWNGEELKYKHFQRLDENGEVNIEGTICIGIGKFAELCGFDKGGLEKAIKDAEIPVFGYAKTASVTTEVYEKSQILELDWYKKIMKKIADYPHVLNANGDVTINNIVCVSITRFAKLHNVDSALLQQTITDAGIKTNGKARSYQFIVDVYPKEEIEARKCVERAKKLEKPDVQENGEVVINGIIGITVRKFARCLGVSNDRLQEAINEAQINDIGMAQSGAKTAKVYPKSKVVEIEYVKRALDSEGARDDNGQVKIAGKAGITVRKFSEVNGLDHQVLLEKIQEAGLESIGTTRTHTHTLDVYAKKEVMNLEYVKIMLGRGNNELNEKGEVIISGITCIGVSKFAQFCGNLDSGLLQKYIESAGLPVIGTAKSGPRTVNAYEKSKVISLPYVKERHSNSGEKRES